MPPVDNYIVLFIVSDGPAELPVQDRAYRRQFGRQIIPTAQVRRRFIRIIIPRHHRSGFQIQVPLSSIFRTLEFDNAAVKMQIWDTAGQERFRTITSAYYKNAQGIMVVYDLKIHKTFENMETFWLDEIKKYAEKDVQLVIVGNKADCQNL